MKKILLIIPLILAILVFGDFRTSGYRTARNPRGTYNFETITADSTIINDYLLVGDTTTANGGFVFDHTNSRLDIFRDTITFSSWFSVFEQYDKKRHAKIWISDVMDGSNLYIRCNDEIKLEGKYSEGKGDTNIVRVFWGEILPGVDTCGGSGDRQSWLGSPLKRWRNIWGRHIWSSSPDKSESLHIHIEADTAYYESDLPNKFDNDMFVDGEFETSGKILVGAGDSLTKFVKIGSHCAVIVNAADTFWLAADTTGF